MRQHKGKASCDTNFLLYALGKVIVGLTATEAKSSVPLLTNQKSDHPLFLSRVLKGVNTNLSRNKSFLPLATCSSQIFFWLQRQVFLALTTGDRFRELATDCTLPDACN